MVNKPGILTQVLEEFANAKVNITALTVVDTAEHGVLRVVAGSAEKIRKLLAILNMPCSETEVLCVTISNKSGALAAITRKLAKAHINISYAYCTAGARGGRTTGVLKVTNVKKAMKILKAPTEKTTNTAKLRRSPASRK